MRSTTRSLVLLVSILSRPVVAAATLPPCPGGQFMVQGSSLVPGIMASGTDSVSFSSTLVGIQSGCAAVVGRVRATSRGTRVKARWDTCDHVIGRAKLSAIVDAATCNTMTGTFKAPKMRVKTPFTAVRSVSGSCNDDTLRIIQTRIFNYRGCNVSTCHGAASGYPPAGNLDLRPGYAYASLVGVPANNPAAQAAGKLRVMAGDAGQSFLSQKLHGTQAADEGSRMPLIGLPLPQTELDLIDAWITAGAPEIGQVAGAPCLPPLQYQPSTAPAPPPGGYQITLDGPTLLPGQEQEGCFWMPVPNATDFYASQFEFVLNPGTHHYSIFPYTFSGTPQLGVWRVNDYGCFSGAMFGNSLSGAPQSPYYVDAYPPGVARLMRAGTYIGLNAHYKNDFDVPIQIKVWTNVYPYAGTPAHVAQTLTALDSTFGISVAPFTQNLQTGRFTNTTGRTMRLVQLAGHMHRHSLRFTARNSAGTKLYESLDWSHPFPVSYDPASPSDVVLAPNDWIDYECLEDNGVTRPVRRDAAGNPTTLVFGVSVDDEMCILTGSYILD